MNVIRRIDCPFRSWAINIELTVLLLLSSIAAASVQTQSIIATPQRAFFHIALERSFRSDRCRNRSHRPAANEESIV